MSSVLRGPQRRVHLARLVFAVAAFAGLFAMHGLGDHGSTHHAAADLHGTAVALAGGGHSGHTADAGHQPDPGPPSDPVGSSTQVEAAAGDHVSGVPADSGAAGAAVLCLAVLVGIAVGLLWRRPSTRLLSAGRPHLRSVLAVPAAALRDRAPPCLHQLSIQRC